MQYDFSGYRHCPSAVTAFIQIFPAGNGAGPMIYSVKVISRTKKKVGMFNGYYFGRTDIFNPDINVSTIITNLQDFYPAFNPVAHLCRRIADGGTASCNYRIKSIKHCQRRNNSADNQ